MLAPWVGDDDRDDLLVDERDVGNAVEDLREDELRIPKRKP
jgi:hypothetical protein